MGEMEPDAWQVIEIEEGEMKICNVKLKNDPNLQVFWPLTRKPEVRKLENINRSVNRYAATRFRQQSQPFAYIREGPAQTIIRIRKKILTSIEGGGKDDEKMDDGYRNA